jgi:hypothetical protein
VREPAADLFGKKWHGIYADTGQGTPEGWTHDEGAEESTARWWPNGFPGPSFCGLEFAKALGAGQELHFRLLDDKVGHSVTFKVAYNSPTEYFCALVENEEDLWTGFVLVVEGDTFYFSVEEGTNGVQAWRQTGAGSPEAFGQGTLAAIYSSFGKAVSLILQGAGAFRGKNFRAGSLNPEPPIEEKTVSSMAVALNANWAGDEAAADVSKAVSLARYETEIGTEMLEGLLAAGLKVHLVFAGPYNEGGVSALDPDEWVADTLAFYEANVTPDRAPIVEVLNEPGGSWFWGEEAQSPTNALAYRALIQKAYEAFHTRYGDDAPKIIGSVEGSDGLTLGEEWWTPECAAFVDGIVVHPYGGTGEKAESALGNRTRVEEAYELTGMPVYITEVGWPTAVEEEPTGDSLQWTEDEQAANIKSFLAWARGTRYVAEAVVFTFHDFGTQTWYGVVRLDGSHKPAYDVIRAFAFAPSCRIAVTQEYPPDKLAWRVDPPQGAPSRWAADEALAENVCEDIQLADDMPGGDKEGTCVLARNPRTPWPDLTPYSNCSVYGPGVEEVGCYRLDKAPESDGDRMAISPAAVGWRNALEDDKAIIGPGFIDRDLSKWAAAAAGLRVALPSWNTSATPNVIPDASGLPAISMTSQGEIANIFWGLFYDSLGVRVGGLSGTLERVGVGTHASDANVSAGVFGHDDDLGNGGVELLSDISGGGDFSTAVPDKRVVDLWMLYANGPAGAVGVEYGFRLKNLIVTGPHGLAPQGAFPRVGFTASQMLGYAIPEYTPLIADPEDLEDSGYIIEQAWFSDPGPISQVVQELTKYELLDWFVFGGKRFQMRFPGTYGRRWQAYAGPSGLQEQGLDASRLWQRIVVSYQDVDGSTRTVGPPGSGAMVEDAGLEISDPDHPAVKAAEAYGPNFNRKELLGLKGISSPSRAIEAGERWLAEANLLSRSGSCTLSGYVMDDRGIYRPVSQVRAGDLIRFPDAGDTSYRKVVQRNYAHSNRTTSLALDAPAEGIAALLERMQADIQSLGL